MKQWRGHGVNRERKDESVGSRKMMGEESNSLFHCPQRRHWRNQGLISLPYFTYMYKYLYTVYMFESFWNPITIKVSKSNAEHFPALAQVFIKLLWLHPSLLTNHGNQSWSTASHKKFYQFVDTCILNWMHIKFTSKIIDRAL